MFPYIMLGSEVMFIWPNNTLPPCIIGYKPGSFQGTTLFLKLPSRDVEVLTEGDLFRISLPFPLSEGIQS